MADTAVAHPEAGLRPGRPEPMRTRRPGARREALAAYGFIAPNYLLLLVFVLVPLAGAFLVSLQRTDGFGAGTFAGLDNYARLASDPLFWRALGNTVLFTLLVTPLSMLLGLIAATLLNAALPARPLWRSLLILPMAVSGVATALIGVLVFDLNSGILNLILPAVGLSPVTWQSDAFPALAT